MTNKGILAVLILILVGGTYWFFQSQKITPAEKVQACHQTYESNIVGRNSFGRGVEKTVLEDCLKAAK